MTDGYATYIYAEDVSLGDTPPDVVVEDVQRKNFVRYAGASGDFNPIHYDEPYAVNAGYPSTFGQGMYTAGIMAHAAADWFGLINVQRFRTRFQAQVFPSDTIQVHGEVTEKDEEGDGAIVTAEMVAQADGETVVDAEVVAELPSKPD
jgi:acyl dehydratase